MKNSLFVLGAISLAVLVGCGGSSESSKTDATSPTISGTAATGVGFADSTVTVTDSKGAIVGTSSTVGADGIYSIKLTAGAVAPFVLTAKRTGEDGAIESLVSVVASLSSPSATATANITPITTLIAARLSPSGDPTQLASEFEGKPDVLSFANVSNKTVEVQAILAPIIAATDTGGTNPLTGSFSVNGEGYDRLLDSIKISIVPASASSSNIEIGIKQQQEDNAAPVAIQFSSADKAEDVSKLPAIEEKKLVVSGTAVLIQSFLQQLTSCYAQPLGSRVNSIPTNGVATGDASNVVAPACKAAFFGDNPASFKSNGNAVGRDASGKGAFGSLFKESATGMVFGQGSYEFTRNNGDIVAGYKSRDTQGNETFDTFVLRKDADGKLKLIGNQYNYGGGVTAYQQLRTFVNDAPASYYSTGYALNVPLMNGVAYVKVKTPKDTLWTMIPGSDGMVFPKVNALRQPVQKDGVTLATKVSEMVPSGTSFARVRSEYAGTSTAAHPSVRDTGLFFTETDAADLEIRGYGNQSLWLLEYYDKTNNLIASQSYRTRARANTIAELRTQQWAVLDDSSLSSLKTQFVASTATAPSNNSYTKLPASGLVAPGWNVPSGALPPTSITLYGKAGPAVDGSGTKTSFADAQAVGSTKRTMPITCANGSLENHCVAGGTGYTVGAIMTGLHLWARDPSGREYASFYATYNLN